MQRKELEKFSAGKFAKYCNISKSALLYYDKIGLFRPAGINDNGYRYYEETQVNFFLTIIALRELGVPIRALKKLLSDPSSENLMDITNIHLSNIEDKIEKLNEIKEKLQKRVEQNIELTKVEFNKLFIMNYPERHIISKTYESTKKISDNDEWIGCLDKFIEEYQIKDFNFVGSILTEECLVSKEFEKIHSLFIFSDKDKSTNCLPKGIYAVYYYDGSFKSIPEIYPKIIKEIENYGVKCIGDAYEEYILSNFSVGNTVKYVTKITIRVK